LLDLKFTLTCILPSFNCNDFIIMQTPLHPALSNALREMPRHVYESPNLNDEWSRSALSICEDTALIEAAIDVITRPKRTALSSFALHAPLELLARARLLPLIDVRARDLARRRIGEVATRYAAAGEEVMQSPCTFETSDLALSALINALNSGDAHTASCAMNFLSMQSTSISVNDLRRATVDWVLPRLGAAGHAPILLAALPWAAQSFRNAVRLLCAPIYYLAGSGAGSMTWFNELTSSSTANTHFAAVNVLQETLRATPHIKSLSNSIAPTLLCAQPHITASPAFVNACASVDIADAERVILRVAALSMLHDDTKSAPYGWTHCLTLPQAVLQNRDAARDDCAAIAMAASYVYAFRATQSTVALTQSQIASATAICDDAPSHHRNEHKRQLATRAAIHHDAHLAKYTLACFDAASTDPAAASLYYCAAQRLSDFWQLQDGRRA
jgi:hypothetical protein